MKRMKTLLGVFLMLAAGYSLAVFPEWPSYDIEEHEYVDLLDVAGKYHLTLTKHDKYPNYVSLISYDRTVRFKEDRREALIDGVRYWMSFPARKRGSNFYISSLDAKKLLQPALQPSQIYIPKKVDTVVIDPGHGGGIRERKAPMVLKRITRWIYRTGSTTSLRKKESQLSAPEPRTSSSRSKIAQRLPTRSTTVSLSVYI